MLDRLSFRYGSRKPRRRIGRGVGSGSGKTAGRGTKGAGARTGYKTRPWSEGGQMPLARRLPKRGFRNPMRVVSQIVNVGDLAGLEPSSEVDVAALVRAGLVHTERRPVKLLGNGELKASLRVRVQAASAEARRKVEAAGGSVEIVDANGSAAQPAAAARGGGKPQKGGAKTAKPAAKPRASGRRKTPPGEE
jgi:large subunit ribosomal protein L15